MTMKNVNWGAGSARNVWALSIAGVLGAALSACQGPEVYHREDTLITCAVERQECAQIDSTGQCTMLRADNQKFGATLCVASGTGVDTSRLCQSTFCTGDVNAPGFCTATLTNTAVAFPGLCQAAPAGNGLAEVSAVLHSEAPGVPDESGLQQTFLINRTIPDEGKVFCLDVSQNGAQHVLGPTSTDLSRATQIISLVLSSGNCVGRQPSSLFSLTTGALATASGGGTSATVNIVRGSARAGLVCPTGGDVCFFASLDDLRADVADMTVAGVPLTNLRIAMVEPAPLTTISGNGSPFQGVAAGSLHLTLTGKVNGVDSVFFAGNSDPLRVDVTNTSFRTSGMIAFDDLGPNHSRLPISVSVDARGTPATAGASACASASSLSRLFGFEDVQSWSSSQAALSLLTTPVTQGCGALGIRGQNYLTITGAPFTTRGLVTDTAASVDLFIPTNQPNLSYLGALQMYLSCPSGGVSNQYIGQIELTGKPVGRYSTLRFPLPAATRATLARPLDDCAFSFGLNVNPTGQTWSLDNLRFTP